MRTYFRTLFEDDDAHDEDAHAHEHVHARLPTPCPPLRMPIMTTTVHARTEARGDPATRAACFHLRVNAYPGSSSAHAPSDAPHSARPTPALVQQKSERSCIMSRRRVISTLIRSASMPSNQIAVGVFVAQKRSTEIWHVYRPARGHQTI